MNPFFLDNFYILVLAMAAVTFLPRVFPLIFLHEVKLHPKIQQFLGNIPFAALGALIIPGAFFAADGNFTYGLVGVLTAVLLAYLNLNLLLVVIGSILSIFLFQMWF